MKIKQQRKNRIENTKIGTNSTAHIKKRQTLICLISKATSIKYLFEN